MICQFGGLNKILVLLYLKLGKIIATKKYIAYNNNEQFKQNIQLNQIIEGYFPIFDRSLLLQYREKDKDNTNNNYELLKDIVNLPYFCEYEFSKVKQLSKMVKTINDITSIMNTNNVSRADHALNFIKENALKGVNVHFLNCDKLVKY